MRAGQDDAIVADEIEPVGMQVLVGDDVVIDALVVQPIEEMGVGIVLIERRAVAAEPGMIAGRAIEIGAQAAGIGDARAVEMPVVERAAELRMLVHVEIDMAELQQPGPSAARRRAR